MLALHTGTETASRKWHGLGKAIEATTIQEVLEQGGLNWNVSKRALATLKAVPPFKEIGNPDLLTPDGTEHMGILRHHLKKFVDNPQDVETLDFLKEYLEVTEDTFLPHTNEFSIVRDDTNIPFAVMGRIYECLNNNECIALIEPLMEAGEVVVERAGYFNDGANCWLLARFPEVTNIKGEIIDQYMKLSWSHDGSQKLSASFIAYLRRNNTQICPSVPGSQQSIEIRHTTNAKKRMEIATNLLRKGASYFNALEDQLIYLMGIPLTDTDMEEQLQVLVPDSKIAKEKGHNSKALIKRCEIIDIFDQSKSNLIPTMYSGFSAVSQWCDYKKPASIRKSKSENCTDEEIETMRIEARCQNTWNKNGSGRKMKEDFWKMLIK